MGINHTILKNISNLPIRSVNFVLHSFLTAVLSAVCLSALCSLCEAVLSSLTSSQLELLRKADNPSAKTLQDLRFNINEPLTAILTLNTFATTFGAAIAGAGAAKLFGDQNLIWFSGTFALTILIFSEIIPKTLGVSFAYRLAPFVAHPVRWMVFFLKPIVWLCRSITRLLPSSAGDGNISSKELQTIATLSQESGAIEKDQEKVIINILNLKEKIVRDVMTPRTVTFSLDEQLTIEEAMKQMSQIGSHSRLPVYNGDPDNVTGIVLRRDVLQAAAESKTGLTLAKMLHPVHFVPETAPLNRILIEFFDRRQHLFVVVDEYGAMTGVISLEDVIEEIVGREIVDETDRNKDMRELARSRNLASIKRQRTGT
jgi:CBS domain containing-hemolysin-like protein